MKAKDNKVFATALQFIGSFKEMTPESVIYGYAKLLLMDETQIRTILSDDSMEDLEAAHQWFSNKKLNMKLIKSGLLLLVPLIPGTDAQEKKLKEFQYFTDQEMNQISSADILEKALTCAFIPFAECFAEDKDMDAVFAYQSELKARKSAGAQDNGDKKTVTQETSQNQESEPVSSNQEADSAQKATEQSVDTSKDEQEQTLEGLSALSKKYRKLSSSLLDVVKGQDQAVLKFIQGYNQGELLKGAERGKHPRSYFFFFGPPGVGKTLLAETAATALDLPHKTFNMSEYAAHQSHEDLIGISKIYSSAKEGTLVQFVRENPECVLIFDEIEKAHINTIRQFLQILGSGKLHNVYRDEDVSFCDTTIIFTSNVGRELYADRSINLTTLPEKVLIDAIQREKNAMGDPALPLEICSRIASGNTVMFNHLSIRHLADMVNHNFEKIVNGMEKEYGVCISYTKYLPLLFLYNRGGEIDARVATGQSGRFLKDEIYELLRQMENSKNAGKKISSIQIDVEWEGMDEELKKLFLNSEQADVLVFASEGDEIFNSLNSDKYVVHRANNLEEARQILMKDIAAVFIDPFSGSRSDNETILSISDYNTDGVRLFHELIETRANLPIYLLEMNRSLSEVDKRTFLQEGAAGTAAVSKEYSSSFVRQFEQIMEELYMEKESQNFSQRGWVIDFNTKQEISDAEDKVKILFYGLKKRMAVDLESRGSILSDVERPNIGFEDVIGAENAKEELKYFVKYLRNPKQFLMTGGKPPKGVLLYGPPGTGKTMLAKAMAGESDVTFLETSATEFMNRYVGESEANIRRIFQKAKKYAPAIIFIDEIDAIGKKRTGRDVYTESMLNALLTEMDGFSSGDMTKPVFVLAATNYGVRSEEDGIAALDEALIRRFDNKIYVDLPKERERKEYILKMLEKRKIDSVSEEAAQSIAERTTGESLANLQNVLEIAIRNANRAGEIITDDYLLTALEEYSYGEKKEHSQEYYRNVAIHETGHAYVSYISGDKPTYITIESRGNFGGYMQHANTEEVTGYTREELLAKIRTSLAGRAAEQVFYGKEKALNTGASSDLQHATEWAFRILCAYGMEEGQLVVLKKDDVLKSALAAEYVSKVNEILKREMQNTIAIIEEAKDKIQTIAEALVKENRLTGDQFEKLMNEVG